MAEVEERDNEGKEEKREENSINVISIIAIPKISFKSRIMSYMYLDNVSIKGGKKDNRRLLIFMTL